MVAPYRAPRTAICEPFLVNPNRDVRVPWWPPDLTRSECGRALVETPMNDALEMTKLKLCQLIEPVRITCRHRSRQLV